MLLLSLIISRRMLLDLKHNLTIVIIIIIAVIRIIISWRRLQLRLLPTLPHYLSQILNYPLLQSPTMNPPSLVPLLRLQSPLHIVPPQLHQHPHPLLLNMVQYVIMKTPRHGVYPPSNVQRLSWLLGYGMGIGLLDSVISGEAGYELRVAFMRGVSFQPTV